MLLGKCGSVSTGDRFVQGPSTEMYQVGKRTIFSSYQQHI